MEKENEKMILSGEYTIGGVNNQGILGALEDQRSEVQFCDVILRVEDKEYPAHRCVLAAASPYFRSMFEEYHFTESRKQSVELKSVPRKALDILLDMIYSGILKLNVNDMHQVLSAADHLLMNEVKYACAEFMLMVLNSEIASEEALRIRRSAELFSLTDLEHEADRVITLNFASVAKSAAFCDLTDTELLSFLKSDYIQESDERVFWEAATNWIKHDPESREHLLDPLMECIRFPLISPQILVGVIERDPLMAKSRRCYELIQEAMKYQLLPELQSSTQSPRTKPRCTPSDTVIYCLSGSDQFKCYIPRYDTWYSLSAPRKGTEGLSPKFRTHSQCKDSPRVTQQNLVSVAGMVYACTQATRPEEVGNFELIRLQQFDLSQNLWKECALPKKVSVPTFLIECNNVLYACSRNAIERYHPENNSWEVVSVSRLSPCQFAVSDDNHIFLYTLEEGICQEMAMDRPSMVTTRQVMSPNRFVTEVVSATKLPNHEIFLSLRTQSGISRKIVNVKSNLWRDAGILPGSSSMQYRSGQNFPLWLDPAEPWQTMCDRNHNSLFILATKSGLNHIAAPPSSTSFVHRRGSSGTGCQSSNQSDAAIPVRDLPDAVLPFFLLDIAKKSWTRLAAMPEFMGREPIKSCISDGQCSMGSASVL